ncbi:MAG: hypothetical protein AB7F97_14775 [Solirubrobacterales bacterium]
MIPKPDNPEYDATHRGLRMLFERLWDPAAVSNGLVRPARDKMEERQRTRWPGDSAAARVRTPSAANALDGACTRFGSHLDAPFDPSGELDLIVPPIADFLIALHRIKPFGKGQKGLELLAMHDCCKFAGCPPPQSEKGERSWRDALRKEGNTSPAEQLDDLTDRLYNGILTSSSGPFAEAVARGRGRTHRARTRRREAIAHTMRGLIVQI